MSYGIIGAMDEEINYLRNEMIITDEHQIANSLFIEGTIDKIKVVLLKSGIGKVNAAMATTILLEKFKPKKIINTGSAGGFSTQLNVGDIVVSDEVVYHDVDVTAFDYAYGQVPQLPPTFRANPLLIEKAVKATAHLSINHKIGLIATGDTFMSNPNQIAKVREIFPTMLAAEMEGAAIAQVCHQYNVPFVIIRSLSDIAGEDSPITFEQYLDDAAKNASKLILSMIRS